LIPEIGHFLIILALWVSVAQTLICFGGAVRSSPRLIAFPRYSSYVIFLLTLAGFCCLAPESDAAKYARGRLALPEMLEQFQREANVE